MQAVAGVSFTAHPAASRLPRAEWLGQDHDAPRPGRARPPDAGSATIGGKAYAELTDPLQTVGTMLDASAHPARTARDHLRVLAAEAGVPPGRADELLALVDLDGAARRRAGGYSLGMRQRLGLAGALLGDPPVLVLDEPANGLDPIGMRWLRDFLRGLAAEGRTVLVSSHALTEVAQRRTTSWSSRRAPSSPRRRSSSCSATTANRSKTCSSPYAPHGARPFRGPGMTALLHSQYLQFRTLRSTYGVAGALIAIVAAVGGFVSNQAGDPIC